MMATDDEVSARRSRLLVPVVRLVDQVLMGNNLIRLCKSKAHRTLSIGG